MASGSDGGDLNDPSFSKTTTRKETPIHLPLKN